MEVVLFWKTVAGSYIETEPLRVANMVLRLYRDGQPAFQDSRLELLTLAASRDPAAVWPMIGTELLRSQGTLGLQWDLSDSDLILKIPASIIVDWVNEYSDAGAIAVAESFKLPEREEFTEIARLLIRDYGGEVGDIILGRFLSGTWTGSETNYLRSKLEVARKWADDRDARIRAWADRVCQVIERQFNDAELREEEETLK